MKIMMLGWELPPHNSGGLGVACLHLSRALARAGADIDFLLPYTAQYPDVDFMTVTPVTDITGGRMVSRAYDSYNDIAWIQTKYEAFAADRARKTNPDVIHAHDWLTLDAGIAAKKVCDAPLVVHVHATEFERAGGGNGNPLVHEIEQTGLLLADRIFAVSQITKDIIVTRYGIPEDKVEVAHNALDPASLGEYSYDSRTYAYLEGLKREGYTIISTVGRLTLMKGMTGFLKAAARASEKYDRFAFLIAGDGEQKNELIALAARLGIADKVFFTGFVRGKQWRDAYSVSDVFVMNSSSEPFGLTALEAAHHDNALIISRQSGVGEVLRSVLRVDSWDSERLADQLVGIATSAALRESLRRDVKDEYARLSWDDVARTCMAGYASSQTRRHPFRKTLTEAYA